MLEEVPLPGNTIDEAKRKSELLKLPRAVRAAIRRLHNRFGHPLKEPLIEVLRAAKCPDEYIKAAKHFRCPDCERTDKLPKQTEKVSMPKPYTFNIIVGIDGNYLADSDGATFMLLNIVDT
eukprot:10066762-Karenia_brevis.AAC.1